MIKKPKEQKGITLIALVITIIILLILAGVVLTMVFNGGIIDKSQKAVDKTRVESFKEEATIAMIGRKIEKEGTLEESLTAAIIGNKTVEAAENVDDVCYVTRNGDTITVYENGDVVEGRVSIWDGTSKAVPEIKEENGKFNWYIYTAEELKFLADYVNNARQLNEDLTSYLSARNYSASDVVMDENTTVYLMNNIDLGAREGEEATIEAKWETASNEAKKWEPIGIDNSIKKMVATFEGNNHTISGVYVNSTKSENGHGIFGNSSTINNLTVKNSYIKGGTCTGGIVGALRSGKINNCHNKNTIVVIEGNNRIVGGVAGQVGSTTDGVYNCTNNGIVIGNGKTTVGNTEAGGIVGRAYTVTGCNNSGNVTGQGNCVGGVVGNASTSSQVTGCNNSGNVTGQDYVGGAVGEAANIVTKCSNTGNVTGNGTKGTGGIVGDSLTGKGQDISLCYNSGEVRGNGQVGGISGYLGSVNANPTGKEYKCYNKGKVINTGATGIAGGVVGNMAQDANVTNCYYLNTIGVDRGVYSIGSGGDIDLQNQGATAVSDDLTYEEFKTWIETK